MPICVGDNIEFSITFYSLRGLIDLDSLTWEVCYLEPIPEETPLTYNREAKMSRILSLRLNEAAENDHSPKLKEENKKVKKLEEEKKEVGRGNVLDIIITGKKRKTKETYSSEEEEICYDKIVCDLNRICEIEDSEDQWYDYDYFLYKNAFPLKINSFKPMFKINSIVCAGLDILVMKMRLLAVAPGI